MVQDERIKKEYDRLMEIFQELNENERTVADGLIQEAAYMHVAMDDLKETIKREGVQEKYQNGEHQHGFKQSVALKSYNDLAKTYKTIIDRLLKITPVRKPGAPTFNERWNLMRGLEKLDEVDEDYRNTPEYVENAAAIIRDARAFMEKLYPSKS